MKHYSQAAWKGRLPQELRIRVLKPLAAANEFLRTQHIAEFNAQLPAQLSRPERFHRLSPQEPDLVFALQHE